MKRFAQTSLLGLVFGALLVPTPMVGAASVPPAELATAQIAAFERIGLDPTEAQRELEAQDAVVRAELVQRLERNMGSEFGGAWFDLKSSKLRVGFISASGRLAAERTAAAVGLESVLTLVKVRTSWGGLARTQEWLNHQLRDLLANDEAATALVPQSNAVEVRLSRAVDPRRISDLGRAGADAGVDLELVPLDASALSIEPLAQCRPFEKNKAFCDPTIAAGVTIRDPAGIPCTSGPTVLKKDLSLETTETFVLTAGHCIDEPGEQWDALPKNEVLKKLGDSVLGLTAKNDEVDVGAIKVENAEWTNPTLTPVNASLESWTEAESNPLPVTGSGVAVVNQMTCRSGQTTGTSCGKIKAVHLSLEGLEELVEVRELTAAAQKGDSGGPFFVTEKAGVRVEGTLVGNRRDETGVETEFALFEPIQFSLTRLAAHGNSYELLTTANEKRPKCPMAGGEACFYAGSYPATLTGAGTSSDAFTFNAGTVKCNASSYSQTLEEPLPTLELAPSFAECTAFGFVSTTIDANGCKLKPSVTGAFSVGCPEGKAITVTAFNCWVKIGTQTNSGFTSTNTTSATPKPALDLNLAISGLTYTQESKSFPGCSSGTRTDGKLTASITVKGDNGNGEAIGVGRS